MSSQDEKGRMKADIPEDAIAEALKSVERVAGERADDEKAEGEVDVPLEGGGADPEEARRLRDEVRTLKAMLEDSFARARETQERLKDNHERLLRALADLENYKKRAAREKDEMSRFAAERVFKDLLPVVDNLERALATAEGSGAAGLVEGVRLVTRQFVDVLGRHGVKGYSALGQPFDPSQHEALMHQETADVPPGHVALEMLKGYRLHDRLLRPAAVAVARAPSPTSAPPEPPQTDGGGPDGGTDGAGGGQADGPAQGRSAEASASPEAGGDGHTPGRDG